MTPEPSDIQKEMLYWLSVGKTAADIAEIRNRSTHTISESITRMLKRFDVPNTPALVCKALRNGWIQ